VLAGITSAFPQKVEFIEMKINEVNEIALYDILNQLIEGLHATFEELEHLRGVVCSNREMRELYEEGLEFRNKPVSPVSIRSLHERVLAITRKLREQQP
jgi:hypothetical protein